MLRWFLIVALSVGSVAGIEAARPVRLEVTVRNADGKIVGDLTPEDFQVIDTGSARTVDRWSKVVDWFGRTSYHLQYMRPTQETRTSILQAIEVKVRRPDVAVNYKLKKPVH